MFNKYILDRVYIMLFYTLICENIEGPSVRNKMTKFQKKNSVSAFTFVAS